MPCALNVTSLSFRVRLLQTHSYVCLLIARSCGNPLFRSLPASLLIQLSYRTINQKNIEGHAKIRRREEGCDYGKNCFRLLR